MSHEFDGDSDRVADAGIFRSNSDHCGIGSLHSTNRVLKTLSTS